jgi:hypothetical protein
MRRKNLIILIILIIFPALARADVIYFRDGKDISGKGIKTEEDRVCLKVKGRSRNGSRIYEVREFRVDEVLAIKRDGEKLIPITVISKADTLSYNNIVRETHKKDSERSLTAWYLITMSFALGITIWSFTQY